MDHLGLICQPQAVQESGNGEGTGLILLKLLVWGAPGLAGIGIGAAGGQLVGVAEQVTAVKGRAAHGTDRLGAGIQQAIDDAQLIAGEGGRATVDAMAEQGIEVQQQVRRAALAAEDEHPLVVGLDDVGAGEGQRRLGGAGHRAGGGAARDRHLQHAAGAVELDTGGAAEQMQVEVGSTQQRGVDHLDLQVEVIAAWLERQLRRQAVIALQAVINPVGEGRVDPEVDEGAEFGAGVIEAEAHRTAATIHGPAEAGEAIGGGRGAGHPHQRDEALGQQIAPVLDGLAVSSDLTQIAEVALEGVALDQLLEAAEGDRCQQR